MTNAIHPPPAESTTTHANTQRQTYNAPTLTAFGSITEVTAGGTRPGGVEIYWIGCQSRNSWIACPRS